MERFDPLQEKRRPEDTAFETAFFFSPYLRESIAKEYLLNHSPGTIFLASLTHSVTFNEDVGSALDTLFLNLESFDLLLLPDHDLQFVRKRWLDGITVAMDMN